MKLLVLILNKVELLDELLEALADAHIGGATILQSRGMAQELYHNAMESSSFLGSLRLLLDPDREQNLTILTVVHDDKVPVAVDVIERVVGDLERPDTAVVFTIPVDFTRGIH